MNKVKKKTHPKGLELENTKLKNQILRLSRENYKLKKEAEKLTTAKLKIEFLKELLYESIRQEINFKSYWQGWSHLLGSR